MTRLCISGIKVDAKQQAACAAEQICIELVAWLSRAEQGRAGQGRAGQGRAGQGRAGQGRAGQGRAGQGRAGRGRAGQGRAPNVVYGKGYTICKFATY